MKMSYNYLLLVLVSNILICKGGGIKYMENKSKDMEKSNRTDKAKIILNRLTEGSNIISNYPIHENIVLVLGNTGVGKSTLVQYIAGNNSKLISKAIIDEEGNPLDDYIIEDRNPKIMIGTSQASSYTQFPERVFDEKTNTVFYDCPGFSDTRGAEYDISGAYFIQKIANTAKAVKLVFVIDYSSVKIGSSREGGFNLLAKHATSLVKNIDKFKDGIALVATKVDDRRKSDKNITKTIATYLQNLRDELMNKSEPTQEEKNAIPFLKSLVNDKNRNKIGFIRQPTEPGVLSNITAMQDRKKSLETLLYKNTTFVMHDDPRDFNYTISDHSKNYVSGLVKEINENILSSVADITKKVQEHYQALVQKMLDKINSFVNITGVNADVTEAELFVMQFNTSSEKLSALVKDFNNILTPKQLGDKINGTIAALDFNRFTSNISDIISSISTQGEYLEFLQNFSNETLTLPMQWKSSFQDIELYLSKSKNNVQSHVNNAVKHINNKIKTNIECSGESIKSYYHAQEKTIRDIGKFYDAVRLGYDSFSLASQNKTQKECIEQITNEIGNLAINDTNISAAHATLSSTAKYSDYFAYLNTLNNQSNPNSPKCTEGLNDLIKYLEDTKKWYGFLKDLYDSLSDYEIQKNTSTCKNLASKILVTQRVDTNKESKVELKPFLEKCYLKYEYENIKSITLSSPKLNALNKVLDFTLGEDFDQSCNSNKLVLKGHYVKLSDIDKANCFQAQFIEIFASNTVLIDTDLDRTGQNVFMTIIAPTWDIQGQQKITLDGQDAEAHNPPKAKDYENGLPGKPGGSGGYFLGIGEKFINANGLTISANGGEGGPGQHGGNGKNGADGAEPKYVPPDSTLLSSILDHKCKDVDDYCKTHFPGFEFKIDGSYPIRSNIIAPEINTAMLVTIEGKTAEVGGKAKDGGAAGKKGFAGKVVLIPSNDQIMVFTTTGKDGKPGNGGEGGVGGVQTNIQGALIEQTRPAGRGLGHYTVVSDHQLKDRKVIKHNANNGTNGITGNNSKGIKEPTKLTQPSYHTIITNYQEYLITNLANDSIIKSDLENFHYFLNNNLSITNLYNTLGFVSKFHLYEELFPQLHDKIDFLPLYQSLLNRVYEYNKNPSEKLEDSVKLDDCKAVLNYLYTAISTKIYSIKNNQENSLVIDIEGYFSLVEKHIEEYKKTLKEVNINKHREEYHKIINIQITNANDLIEKEILPEIDKIYGEIDRNINLLVEDVVQQQKEAKKKNEDLIKQRQDLAVQTVWRVGISVLKVAAQFLSVAGPVGTIVSGVAGTGLDIAENQLLNGHNSITSTAQTSIKDITSYYKNQQSMLKINFDQAKLKLSNDPKIQEDDLKKVLDKIKFIDDRFNQTFVRTYKIWGKTNDDLKEYRKELLADVETYKNKQKEYQKIQKDKEIESKIQVSIHLQILINTIQYGSNELNKYKENEKLISALGDDIKLIEEEVSALKKYEQTIYNTMMPMVDTLNDSLGNTIQQSSNKSHAGLDDTKRQIQEFIKDFQIMMQHMFVPSATNNNIKANFMRCIEKLQDGMLTVINIYDRIQDEYDKKRVADLITNVVLDTKITNNKTLSYAIDKLELTMKSNLVLHEYKQAMNAFKQYMFPFAYLYLGEFELNNKSDLISNAITQVGKLKDEVQKNRILITTRKDNNAHSKTVFHSKNLQGPGPFFVWKHEIYQREISKLLQGKEIVISSNIAQGIEHNAIKFNEIGIHFKLLNTTLQKDLDDKLHNFQVNMTHPGNSYYKCGSQFYIIYHEPLQIRHYVTLKDDKYSDPNDVSLKIQENCPILSPYTMWRIQLFSDKENNSLFDQFTKYINEPIDLELVGKGRYLEKESICSNNLKEYYKVVDNILPLNSHNKH